jgi:phage FluMu protein Com
MISTGKCPNCEKVLTEIRTEAITIGQLPMQQWQGISYVCPYCSKILNVEIDPIAIKSDIIAGVKALLKNR